MKPTLAGTPKIQTDERDGGEQHAGAVGEDADAIVCLEKTLAALAHVHGILVRLRDRAAGCADTSEGGK